MLNAVDSFHGPDYATTLEWIGHYLFSTLIDGIQCAIALCESNLHMLVAWYCFGRM